MEVHFPVNSGNVPPPSHSANLLPQQLNAQNPFLSNSLELERILGLTSISPNIVSVADDLIAYAAGAVVVIYSQKKNKQIAFLYPPPNAQSTSNVIDNSNGVGITNFQNQVKITALGNGNLKKNDIITSTQTTFAEGKKATPASNRAKPISCLTFSPDGNYLAAGEMGHQPRIFIWDVKEKKLLREIRSHKFGVLALSFSPNMRHLVSVGFQHDGYLYVWDWKKETKIAGNKDSHSRETRVLDGRSGLLGVLRDANFVDVACENSSKTGYTYCVTDTGILCSFKAERVLDKWLDLQVKYAYSIAVTRKFVICSCSEGIIRLFEPITLKYLGTLPKPHPLGTDVTTFTSPNMVRQLKEAPIYPDSVAMVYEANSSKVISIYSDRSLYIWDIHDIAKVGKSRSFIYHSDCVWGVEPCPRIDYEDNAIPLNSFTTFSADGTIRIWNIDNPHNAQASSLPTQSPEHVNDSFISPSNSTTVSAHRRNIYSRELVKMLYVDSEAAEFSKIRGDIDSIEDQYPDYGIRSVKISSDGSIIASGDRSGNLRVHDMRTWKLLNFQEAHDSEILSIDLTTSENDECPNLIATASRDRMIHIFDISSKFQLIQSLDDHSSSITSVRFTKDGSKLISCGADKGIIFRQLTGPIAPFYNQSARPYTTYHNFSGRSTVFDMSIDVNNRHIAAVTGERRLFVFNVDSGKSFRTCKPETAEEMGKSIENSGGSLINVDLDPFSGTYAVTSGSDRCIRLFDLVNNTCIEKICAHAELITSVKFIQTNSEESGLRIISTCSDGTIFIWRVTPDVVVKMLTRAGHNAQDLSSLSSKQRLRRTSFIDDLRPVVSTSQFIRYGDRKTFSSCSAAEQKYEKLYRRIASTQNRQIPRHVEENGAKKDKSISTSCVQHNVNTNTSKGDNSNTVAPSNNDRTVIIKRLYSGLPTSFKTPDQLSPALPYASNRETTLLSAERNMNHRLTLKRAKSREILRKENYHRYENSSAQSFKTDEVFNSESDDTGDEDGNKKGIAEQYVEEENEIIFTPEEENMNKPFEVSVNNNNEEALTGRSTPETDAETQSKSEEEEDELSSEDNIDEAIDRDITSAEAPRVTVSMSR
ncbi:hypothetical protein BDF20DRAFT_826852, partial [Mycotypha africana]|uniref:uncharacterized protein n=1 Tax=Mycotypha africana TaxID=64632 RepID=UPI0023017A58